MGFVFWVKRNLCLLLCIGMLAFSGCSFPNGSNADNSHKSSNSSESVDLDSEQAKKEQKAFDDWCQEQFVDTMEEMDTINLHYTLNHPENYGIEEKEEDISFGSISVEDIQQSDEENTKTYKDLKKFSYKLLTKEQKLTYDVMDFYLALGEEGKGFELYTTALSPDLGIPANIPVELAEYPLHSAKDVEIYLTLLTKLPDYFKELAEYERQVSKAGLFISDATLDDSLKQMKEFIANPEQNYLITTFKERVETIEELSKEQKENYTKQNESSVKKYIVPAYEQLIQDIDKLRGTGKNEGGLCHFKKGKDYYSYLAKYYTCSNMKVSEIWSILSERMDNLMERLSNLVQREPGVFDDYDAIRYSMTEPNEILTYLQKAMQEYYPECPSVNYTVKHVDESLAESLSPAFYMVPQIDNYKDNTIYINDKSSNFRQDDLYSTLAHEGFPGHLFQTTYYDSTNPEPIRQILNFGGYCEGWATYVELSSYELYDFGSNDAAVTDLCQIESEISLALSSMADIGVNYKGWDKSRLKVFLDEYNMGDGDIVNDVYTLVVEDPGNYLQYYVSYLEFWNLRCMAKTELDDAFSSREFHKVILDCGPAPFSVLEKQVKEYIRNE